MQRAETVLGVLRDRGRKGLPCTQLYRQMFNSDLYLLAYGKIYANQGAMTPGTSEETADGMSEDKIDQIIEAMRHERYRFSSGPPGLHPEEERKAASAGTAVMVGQARRRGGPPAVGGVLRTDVLRLVRTGSGPAEDATPPCGKWSEPGPGPRGLSKGISPTASDLWTTI